VTVNGGVVEQDATGAWWVQRAGRRARAWRFASRTEALRFAGRLRPPVVPAPAPRDEAGLQRALAAWVGGIARAEESDAAERPTARIRGAAARSVKLPLPAPGA
jgi:hypothetical protein